MFAIVLSLVPAGAEDDTGLISAGRAEDGLIISVGVMPQITPDFPGAKTYGVDFLPQFSFRHEGEPAGFSAPDDGFDYAIVDSSRMKLGPVGNYESGRSSNSDHALAGLDPYAATLQAGAFVEAWPLDNVFRTRLEVMHGFRNGDGFLASFSADLVYHDGPFTVSGGPRLTLADRDEMQLKFGVSPEAVARSGQVSAFDAGGGVEALGVNAAINYDWSQDWTLTAFSRYDRLVGDAADSPITRLLGSADQLTIGMGLTYRFISATERCLIGAWLP